MNIWIIKQTYQGDAGQRTVLDRNGNLVDIRAMEWENTFINEILLSHSSIPVPNDLSLNGLAERSYEDGVDDDVNSNFIMMFGGFSLLFVYVSITMGGWNIVEQRVRQVRCFEFIKLKLLFV